MQHSKRRGFSVRQPRPQDAYLVPEADWKRIKRMVGEVVPHKNTFQIGASISAGVFATSAFTLLSFWLSKLNPPPAMGVTIVISVTVALPMTAVLFYVDSHLTNSTVRMLASCFVRSTD